MEYIDKNTNTVRQQSVQKFLDGEIPVGGFQTSMYMRFIREKMRREAAEVVGIAIDARDVIAKK